MFSLAILSLITVIYFINQEKPRNELNDDQIEKDCRQISVCSLCLAGGCVWTNSSKFPCRYDGSDFDRSVVVPCGNPFDQRKLQEFVSSIRNENEKRLDWSLILQLVSYSLGIILIYIRYHYRGIRRPYWERPHVYYRPLERVQSGEIEICELTPLI